MPLAKLQGATIPFGLGWNAALSYAIARENSLQDDNQGQPLPYRGLCKFKSKIRKPPKEDLTIPPSYTFLFHHWRGWLP